MTYLSPEVREVLIRLSGAFGRTRANPHPEVVEAEKALIAAVEAAQLQRLGKLSDAESVEAAAKAMYDIATETEDVSTTVTRYVPWDDLDETFNEDRRDWFRERTRAALPVLQAPLRAENALLRVAMGSLKDDLAAARETLATAEKMIVQMQGWIDHHNTRADTAEARVLQLTEALMKHGRHNTYCAKFGPLNPRCSCGLDALQP